MKFEFILQVDCKKTGLELFDEYERLGFEKTPNRFALKTCTFEVDPNFVRKHSDFFNEKGLCRVVIDSGKTDKNDWDDWGSCGHMFIVDLDRAETLAFN